MGRPRKQPANILTANIPLTTWERLDALRLKNRSVWLNRVIMDELDREDGKEDLTAARYEATKNQIAVKNDPAARLSEVADKQLLASALARIPDSKKRLKNDLLRLIREL
jgi:hypothetical protein